MLLDGREEAFRGAGREDHGLAAKGTDLGPADVEYVAEILHVRQREINRRARQGVSEAGAVDIEQQAVAVRHVADGGHLGAGIDGPELGRQGDVNQPREDHVVAGFVALEGAKIGFQLRRIHLSVVGREGQDLVAGVFHRAGFMDADMAGLDGDGAFGAMEERRNDGGVGLRPADKEEHLPVRTTACVENLAPGALGIGVEAVTFGLFEVGFGEAAQDLRVRALGIVTFERNHITQELFFKYSQYICGNKELP